MAYVLEELQKITPKGIRRLQEDLSNALKRIQDLDSQNKAMRAELIELRKKANVTVTATIAEAIRGPATSKGRRRKDWLNEEPQGFEQFYRAGRSESHYRWVGKVLWNFTSALRRKGETPVGSVSAAEIDKWLATTRKADGAEHNPLTRRAYKNALSVFFRWASKAFGMGTNPMRDVDPVRGVVFENIVAIRQVSDLASLLKALEPWPYWQAWLAVATLAGPRYSEQARLKVSDVLLQEGHLRIRATKTGKQRMVPIEQSILDPILKQHLARRRRESSGGEFLFPALTGPGVHERKKSEPHRWSHNRCWHTYWSAAIAKAAELKNMTLAEAIKKKKLPEYWGYGPREWRHTFGTLLGLSGWNALEIARVMGNSPMVADQHYVAVSSKGKGSRLKLKW
ncbi:MAG: site-specific integrase [Planctomycetota bacterium]|nr:site-specific integrase [Planctomycetota bacterium]